MKTAHDQDPLRAAVNCIYGPMDRPLALLLRYTAIIALLIGGFDLFVMTSESMNGNGGQTTAYATWAAAAISVGLFLFALAGALRRAQLILGCAPEPFDSSLDP
jgi:hypothetical protein